MDKIEIPIACPACGGEVERRKDQLFCINNTCSATTLKILLHYVKTTKIMGLGEKTLDKLNIESITELYNFTEQELITILGEKIGTKIYKEINKSKVTTLQRFLSAQSIPLIGKTAGEKIENTVSSISEITEEVCKKAGLGEKATNNLMNWIHNEYIELPITFLEAEPVQSGLAVCVSGKIPGYTKAKIKELLKDYNVAVKDSVTKDLDYLITNESNTAKVNKAKTYNITVMNFSEFMEKVKNE